MKNLDVENHEILHARGESIPLSRLFPLIKGNWTIRVRITKKSEVRSWQNSKGEGRLQNLDFVDREGSHMQGTLFREMVDMFSETFQLGSVYEISQGVVKASSTKYTQAQNDHCFVFDKFTKVKSVEDDSQIDGG